MKTRTWSGWLLATGLAVSLVLLFALAVAAQSPAPPWQEDEMIEPLSRPLNAGAESRNAPAVSLGQPGLSFRYVQTFGVTEAPYLEDNNHFYVVEGIGTDGTNIWATDSWGARLLKFDANGNFLQKIGKAGVVDYTGTPLDYLTDVAVDSGGNIWVAVGGAHYVAKYDSSGNKVGELGDAWDAGSDNSHFNDPISIAFDAAGNIYVSDSGLWGSDYGNHRVQIFDSSGNYLATIGQTGVCGSANDQLCGPRRLAVYGNQLYVADAGNHRVQVFDITNPTSPSYVTTLGQTGNPGSENDQFDSPESVGVDASYIYVADSNNQRVQVFNRTTYAYVATIGASSWGTDNNHFNHPTDVAIDAAGNIYVADAWNKRIQQYDAGYNYVRTYGTTGVSYVTDGSHFYFPIGIAIAGDGSIYVVEERGHRLVKLDANGVPQWTVGEPGQNGSDSSHFFGPTDVAVDGAGRVYTVESWGNHRVQIFNPDGTHYATLGGWGTGNYQFKGPRGIAIDHLGNIYIADRDNHRVQIYNSQFVYVATMGETGVPGSDNAHFSSPHDVTVDANGTIYVADEGNDRVQVFDSNRQYVRTIGGGGTGSDFDHFDGWGPHQLAVDSQNRLYVTDAGNTRVQVFDSNGAYLTTIGGSNGNRTSQFRHVVGIAIGPDDTVYTTEIFDNHRIQKFAPGVPGWKQVNLNGFGDPENGILYSLAPFQGHLYAGTYNSNGAQLWRTGSDWTAVTTDGFGNPYNNSIPHLIEFKNRLYAGTSNWNGNTNQTEGGEIWRSDDGLNWTQVISQGFGDPTNGSIFRLAVFSDTLYAGTHSYTSTHGAEIWRSTSGDVGSWERVAENGLGNANNVAIRSFAVFSNTLFAGISNYTDGAQVWRSTNGITWTQVATGGFGNAYRPSTAALAVFQNRLYASTSGGYGACVWRCTICDGSDWEQVITDGFGNPNTTPASALEVFGDSLYFVMGNPVTGMEVWRTLNGTQWEQVAFAGLGDSNNSLSGWDNSVTVWNNRLYIGTWNWANGGEIWKKTVTADFTASPTDGPPGTDVAFTNLSGGDIVTTTWNFGDGSAPLVSSAAAVTHTYPLAGVYTVTLTVEDGVDTDVKTRPAYIRIAYPIYLPLVVRAYNPLLTLYDDFDNAAFDGFYNPLKWQFRGDSNYFTMQQQNGAMVLTSANAPAERDTVMVANMPQERTLQQVQRFQARLKISPDTNSWGGKIQISSDDLGVPGKTWWSASCDLVRYGGGTPSIGCGIGSSAGGEYGFDHPAEVNRWYTARIEIDPESARFCFYIDGMLQGCHTPADASALKTATNLTARIGAWNGDANPTGTLYFDDVYITPVGP